MHVVQVGDVIASTGIPTSHHAGVRTSFTVEVHGHSQLAKLRADVHHFLGGLRVSNDAAACSDMLMLNLLGAQAATWKKNTQKLNNVNNFVLVIILLSLDDALAVLMSPAPRQRLWSRPPLYMGNSLNIFVPWQERPRR